MLQFSKSAGKTWVWTYDDAGNKSQYVYTTGTLGSATVSRDFTYGDSGREIPKSLK